MRSVEQKLKPCPTCAAPCEYEVKMRGGDYGWSTTDEQRTFYKFNAAALREQPAQATPGDAVDADFFRWLNEHPANIQTMADLLRADQYVNLRRACEAIVPNDRRLSATPPGDDAAGGGHRG